MNVNELIEELKKVRNKNNPVKFFFSWRQYPINDIIDNDSETLLGEDLPPEKYERDYKYER